MKIPSNFTEKIKGIGVEHTLEVLELIKDSYEQGFEDGQNKVLDEIYN